MEERKIHYIDVSKMSRKEAEELMDKLHPGVAKLNKKEEYLWMIFGAIHGVVILAILYKLFEPLL